MYDRSLSARSEKRKQKQFSKIVPSGLKNIKKTSQNGKKLLDKNQQQRHECMVGHTL